MRPPSARRPRAVPRRSHQPSNPRTAAPSSASALLPLAASAAKSLTVDQSQVMRGDDCRLPDAGDTAVLQRYSRIRSRRIGSAAVGFTDRCADWPPRPDAAPAYAWSIQAACTHAARSFAACIAIGTRSEPVRCLAKPNRIPNTNTWARSYASYWACSAVHSAAVSRIVPVEPSLVCDHPPNTKPRQSTSSKTGAAKRHGGNEQKRSDRRRVRVQPPLRHRGTTQQHSDKRRGHSKCQRAADPQARLSGHKSPQRKVP